MDYESASPAERERGHQIAREVQRLVWEFVVPVRVARTASDREIGQNSGSGIRLHHAGKHLLITAWHVYAELPKRRARGEECYLLMWNTPLEPPSLLFEDETNDIVVLEVPAAVAERAEGAEYEPGSRWPPRRVTTDDLVLLCGLPAYLRDDSSDKEIVFGDFSVMQPVTRAGENQFVLQLERENWIDLGRAGLPGEEVKLGGISGAPVFALDPLAVQLVGIVSEIGETIPLLYAKSLHHLPASFE